MAEQARHPHLMNPASMKSNQGTAGMGQTVELMSEILKKVNNAKDKPKKIEILKEYDNTALRQLLKGCFDPKIEWLLPQGDVPYEVNDAPVGTEHTVLQQEAKRLYLFTKGGDNTITQNKREMIFVQMLEGLSAEEAEFLIAVVNKKVNNQYKGFTANLVKEAFNWNNNFMKN